MTNIENLKENRKVKDILGEKIFNKVVKILDACCGGISKNGDSAKVLTQTGEFLPTSDVLFLLPSYADDVAAGAGGLVEGQLYRTASVVKVKL
jgi:hypothetical protein